MLKQRGMSIVELVVAMAIGTIIAAALAGIFVNSTQVKHEINRMGEQIENGRIAMEWLSKDVGVAGFWDGLEYPVIPSPALPDICDTAISDLKSAVPVFIQGVDNVTTASTPTCLSDVKLDTDIVAIRRAGTCVIGAAGCESVAPYFQASNCTPPADKLDGTSGSVALGLELNSPSTANWYGVELSTTSLVLHKRDCANTTLTGAPNLADIRRYITRIYYIANNDRSGDGLPSLKMSELRGSTWTVSTIASGIEQLQIEYGQDSAGDTSPETYVAAPSTVADLRQIVTAKIHVLSRNSSPSPGNKDMTKTFVLGGQTYGPFTDSIRRHTFSSLVGIRNPVGLRGG